MYKSKSTVWKMYLLTFFIPFICSGTIFLQCLNSIEFSSSLLSISVHSRYRKDISRYRKDTSVYSRLLQVGLIILNGKNLPKVFIYKYIYMHTYIWICTCKSITMYTIKCTYIICHFKVIQKLKGWFNCTFLRLITFRLRDFSLGCWKIERDKRSSCTAGKPLTFIIILGWHCGGKSQYIFN